MAILLLPNATGFAAMVTQGMTKERAEKELGILFKGEFFGISATNEVGISIEFAPKDKLEAFQFATLDIYLEGPPQRLPGPVQFRRLTSVILHPRIQTKEKVALFFTVDPEYLDKTQVTLRVHVTQPPSPGSYDGYSIRFDSKEFPKPQAKSAARRSRLAWAKNSSPQTSSHLRSLPLSAWIGQISATLLDRASTLFTASSRPSECGLTSGKLDSSQERN
jgi:hypothetical protein